MDAFVQVQERWQSFGKNRFRLRFGMNLVKFLGLVVINFEIAVLLGPLG